VRDPIRKRHWCNRNRNRENTLLRAIRPRPREAIFRIIDIVQSDQPELVYKEQLLM
jgi:hypothetical protein